MKKLIFILLFCLIAAIVGCGGAPQETDWNYRMGDYVMFTEEAPEHGIFASQTAYVLITIKNYKDWGNTYQVKFANGDTMLFKKYWLEEKTMVTQKHYFDEEKSQGIRR